jgi:hypothetical protein
MTRLGIWSLGLVLVAACGDSSANHRLPDAPPPPDAAVDAAPPLPAHEITGGAHKVRGTRFSADVQIGHPIGQQPATGNGRRLEGNAAVKP